MKNMQGLTFEYAKNHVRQYEKAQQSLMDRHNEAMDCYDCEAFLQLGIDAFEWVMRADRAIRSACARGQLNYTAEVHEAIGALCKLWLGPCDKAETWINSLLDSGFQIDNLKRFRECCNEMRAIVEFEKIGDNEELSDAIFELQELAIQEHRDGKTTEIFSDEEPDDALIP